MEIICFVRNQARSIITDASVLIRLEDRTEIQLRFSETTEDYRGELDVSLGDVISVIVESAGYEASKNKEFVTENPIVIILGSIGSKYVRMGTGSMPILPFYGVYGIIPADIGINDLLESMKLEAVNNYHGKLIKTGFVFKDADTVVEGMTNNECSDLFHDNMRLLRESDHVSHAGVVYSIDAQVKIFSNVVEVIFKKSVSETEIKNFIDNSGLSIRNKKSSHHYYLIGEIGCGYELIDSIEEFYSSGLVEFISPELISMASTSYVPGNFLHGGQFTHKVLEVEEAWQKLRDHHGADRTFGAGEIVVAVLDDGLPEYSPVAGQPQQHNPSLIGDVKNIVGPDTPKMFKLTRLSNFSTDHSGGTMRPIFEGSSTMKVSEHGVSVAGIISARATETGTSSVGTAGVAPNTSLFGLLGFSISDPELADGLAWAAGVRKFVKSDSNELDKIPKGFDVLACSIRFTYTSNTDPNTPDRLIQAIDDIRIYARNGRGALMVFAAGNDSISIEYESPFISGTIVENLFAAYPGIISVGGTAFYENPLNEIKTIYSNTGKIDFSAPTSNLGSNYLDYNPPKRMGTWSTTFLGNGDLSDKDTISHNVLSDVPESNPVIDANAIATVIHPSAEEEPISILTANANIGDDTISLASAAGFKAGMYVWLINHSNPIMFQSQPNIKIDSVSGNNITLDSDLLFPFPTGSKCYVSYSYPLTVTSGVHNAGDTTITVDETRGFKPNMWLKLKGSGGGNEELVKVQSISGNDLILNPLTPIVEATYGDDSTVTGLTTIQVGNGALYKVGQFIEIEYTNQKVSHAIGYDTESGEDEDNDFDDFDELGIVKIIGNELILQGLKFHTIAPSSAIKIRRSSKLADSFIRQPFTGIPLNYAPSEHPSAPLVQGEDTIAIPNSTSFAIESFIHITDGTNSEWHQIGDNAGGQLVLQYTELEHNYNAGAGTTITGYAGIFAAGNENLQAGDKLLIKHLTNFILTVHHILTDGTIIIEPSSVTIPGNGSVFKANEILLNSTAGLVNSDKVLLGVPSYDANTRSENSEIVKILHLDTSTNVIYVDRVFHQHLTGPNTIVAKGQTNYTSHFGGTSSACPTVAGVIALVLSANPNLTWAETVDILRRSSDKIDENTPGYAGTPSDITGTFSTSADTRTTFSPSLYDQSRPLGQGRWKNKNGEYIYELDGFTPTGVADTELYYSEWYGYGRVNAKKAVEMALAYSQSNRDLVIRNTLTDTGTAGTPTNVEVNSPDIFVRNIDPINEITDFNTLDYTLNLPHQNPVKGGDRFVYARIKNIGTIDSSLEAKVRFFLVIDDAGTQFKFPEHFTQGGGDVVSGAKGVKLLGEVTLSEGEILPGGVKVVGVPWLKDDSLVETTLETNILVDVTPHDGPFFGVNGEGALLGENNNISRRKMVFREEIEIRGSGIGQLISAIISIPSNSLTSPVTTDFEVSISDALQFLTESAGVRVTLEKFGTSEVIEYKYTTAWGFNTPPTAGWLTLNPPLIEPYDVINTASGLVSDILFKGSFTVDGTVNKVIIEAYFTDSNTALLTQQKTIDVTVQYLPAAAAENAPNEKNTLYFFTEFENLNVQTNVDDAYGPVSANPETQFRTTSKHQGTGSITPKAFAAVTGQVLVQQTSNPNLVNVILKPRYQGAVDFLDVKYFVYRGILKDQLIDSMNEEQVANGTNVFVNSIWDTQQKINQAIENADPGDSIDPGDVTDEPSSRSFGYHFVATSTQSWHTVKLDNESIDDLFFDDVSNFKFPIINAGEEFGKFENGSIGFDIILKSVGTETTFGEVRGTENIISVTALGGTPTDLQKLTDRSLRFKILQFIDPAAFYGIQIYSGINAFDNAGTEAIYNDGSTNNAYNSIISRFKNRNRLYIDIRNENGYSFNYYDNYTDTSENDIKLSFDSGVAPASQKFGSDKWPIKIVENSAFEPGNNGSKNAVWISFPKGDNQQPLLYQDFATSYSRFPKVPKQKNKFLEIEIDAGNDYSDAIKFGVPNQEGLSATTLTAWYLRMTYIRRNMLGNVAVNTMVPNGINGLDNVYPLLDIVPWSTTANIKYVSGFQSRYIERDDFAFMGELGIAQESDRIVIYSVPEDVYFTTGKKVSFFKRIIGGSSKKDSFFNVLENIFPEMHLQKKVLTIGGQEKHCLLYNDPGLLEESENDKKNFFCISMTKTEFDSLLASATASQFDLDLHYPVLKISSVTVAQDDNLEAYIKYEWKIAGIDVNGLFVEAPFVVNAYSVDGIILTTHDFAFAELVPDLNSECISFDLKSEKDDYYTTFGRVIKRVSPFTSSTGFVHNSWQMYDANGSAMMHTAGELDNLGNVKVATDPIMVGPGTRCVLLDCKNLAIPEFLSIKYIRTVCWVDGKIREGYINALAFANTGVGRVLNSEGFTDDELFASFINDARMELDLAAKIMNEVGLSNVNNDFEALISELQTWLDPANATSLIKKYAITTATKKAALLAMLKIGLAQFQLDSKGYNDSVKGYRSDYPNTLKNFAERINDAGMIQATANWDYFPLTYDFASPEFAGFVHYDEAFNVEFSTKCPNLLSEMNGRSGSTVPLAVYPETQVELIAARAIFTARQTANPSDPILKTPEAKWFLDPSRSSTSGTGGQDYFNTLVNLQFISGLTIRNPKNPGHLVNDYMAEGIFIDQSFGSINSNNVLSVFIHELNMGNAILKIPSDTHMGQSSVPANPTVAGTAWEYVKANNFAALEPHGFLPVTNPAYQDVNGNALGSGANVKTETISDFFMRNPVLGAVYLKMLIEKMLTTIS